MYLIGSPLTKPWSRMLPSLLGALQNNTADKKVTSKETSLIERDRRYAPQHFILSSLGCVLYGSGGKSLCRNKQKQAKIK